MISKYIQYLQKALRSDKLVLWSPHEAMARKVVRIAPTAEEDAVGPEHKGDLCAIFYDGSYVALYNVELEEFVIGVRQSCKIANDKIASEVLRSASVIVLLPPSDPISRTGNLTVWLEKHDLHEKWCWMYDADELERLNESLPKRRNAGLLDGREFEIPKSVRIHGRPVWYKSVEGAYAALGENRFQEAKVMKK